MPRDGDYPLDSSRVVLDAIEHHPPGASPGSHVESDLLKDAVALDYLGSVGLSRVFAMVGLEDDVPDLPAAFRHALSLRRNVPELLRLGASRELARERVVEMDEFFANLERHEQPQAPVTPGEGVPANVEPLVLRRPRRDSASSRPGFGPRGGAARRDDRPVCLQGTGETVGGVGEPCR